MATFGDASALAQARDMSARLELVPSQASTGSKPKLLDITKCSGRYLLNNLIHGARAVLPKLAVTDTRLGAWLRALLERMHKNTVIVALANKLARLLWAARARFRTMPSAEMLG